MMIPSLSRPFSINQDKANDITTKDNKHTSTTASNNGLALSELNYSFKMDGEKGEDISY
jgi:hypothetical protein